MVYIVVGLYRTDEYICGVYASESAADERAAYYTDEHSMAGFTYEVRGYEVQE